MLGIIALPFGIFAPFAVWTGATSLRRIGASHGDLGGAGAAAVGLVAGAISLAALLIGIAYWLIASA